jgi:hypothetical protein
MVSRGFVCFCRYGVGNLKEDLNEKRNLKEFGSVSRTTLVSYDLLTVSLTDPRVLFVLCRYGVRWQLEVSPNENGN